MAKVTLNKNDVRKEAIKLLKKGTSKQETFDFLVDKYKFSKEISEVLKNIPSSKAIAKYGIWNNLLIALLILTTIIFLSVSSSIGILLWYGLLIYGVATKRVNYYLWVSVLSTFCLICFIAIFFMNFSEPTNWTITIIMLILIIPSCFLPIWLAKRMCPKPIESKEEYINSEGQKRLKIVYEFTDL